MTPKLSARLDILRDRMGEDFEVPTPQHPRPLAFVTGPLAAEGIARDRDVARVTALCGALCHTSAPITLHHLETEGGFGRGISAQDEDRVLSCRRSAMSACVMAGAGFHALLKDDLTLAPNVLSDLVYYRGEAIERLDAMQSGCTMSLWAWEGSPFTGVPVRMFDFQDIRAITYGVLKPYREGR